MSVIELTKGFVSCSECLTNRATFRRRDRRSALLQPWAPPRGWAGTEDDGPRTIMVVTLNPGAPMPDERGSWSAWGLTEPGLCTDLQARDLLTRCTRNYLNPVAGSDTVFHRKSVGLVRAALWLFGRRDDEDGEWLRHVWFTDAFKCSTEAERGPKIPAAAMAACRTHLQEELRHFRPRVVLTLGTRARDATMELTALPPVIPFKFPSGGLEAVSDAGLDARFDVVATVAGIEWSPRLRAEFREFRETLQGRLFP
jgi:hypothetical protein